MSSLRLDLRQTQRLAMTPQMQQAIRLLQMSNLELARFVEQAANENPLIVIDRDEAERPGTAARADPVPADRRVTPEGDPALATKVFDTGLDNLYGSAPATGRPISGGLPGGNREAAASPETYIAARHGLRDHLLAQIGQMRTPGEALAFACHLVDELDENGYLRIEPAEIARHLSLPAATAEAALALLQACEPTGVGARSLAECLTLQLAERGLLDAPMRRLLANLSLLARGERGRLRRLCGVDDAGLNAMTGAIRRLDPRPGAGFDMAEPQVLIPDILMRPARHGGREIELNADTLPRVLIDRTYAAMVGPTPDQDTHRWLGAAEADANWLVRNLDQRARTILTVTAEIMRRQARFFEEGAAGLRPLTLRAVADATGLHESTVSRVTSNKYIATERGIFELKFFFTNAVGDSRDPAAGIAAESIRHRIRALVGAEDPHRVLSDDAIVARLGTEGIVIARRTVAKYRKSLNIPSSATRRRGNVMREALRNA